MGSAFTAPQGLLRLRRVQPLAADADQAVWSRSSSERLLPVYVRFREGSRCPQLALSRHPVGLLFGAGIECPLSGRV